MRSLGSTPTLSSIQLVTRNGDGRYRIACSRVTSSTMPSWSGSTEPAVSVPWRSSNATVLGRFVRPLLVTVSWRARRHPSEAKE